MYQQQFIDENKDEFWPKPFLLISLAPRYAHAILITRIKKYEYRRGSFIYRPISVFIYATLPKKKEDKNFSNGAVIGLVKFGSPIIGIEAVIRCKEKEEPGSSKYMKNWLEGFNFASAHPISYVHCFRQPISLNELKNRFPKFHPPQKYLRLDRKPEILDFLKKRSGIF